MTVKKERVIMGERKKDQINHSQEGHRKKKLGLWSTGVALLQRTVRGKKLFQSLGREREN